MCSPFQTPIHFDNEQSVVEHLGQVKGQNDVIETTTKLEEGMLQETPISIMDITMVYLQRQGVRSSGRKGMSTIFDR